MSTENSSSPPSDAKTPLLDAERNLDDRERRFLAFAARMMWSARGALLSAGMEPGTIVAVIAGMAIAVGLESIEWGLVMEEDRQFDGLMRSESGRIIRNG